jgi:hypothetical protein
MFYIVDVEQGDISIDGWRSNGVPNYVDVGLPFHSLSEATDRSFTFNFDLPRIGNCSN